MIGDPKGEEFQTLYTYGQLYYYSVWKVLRIRSSLRNGGVDHKPAIPTNHPDPVLQPSTRIIGCPDTAILGRLYRDGMKDPGWNLASRPFQRTRQHVSVNPLLAIRRTLLEGDVPVLTPPSDTSTPIPETDPRD